MSTRTYDPKAQQLVFAGITIDAWADGTFLTVTRDEDSFTKHVGAGGEVARARNRNRGGSVKFSLMQTSPQNDLLSAQVALDEATGAGTGSLLYKDLGGTTLVEGANGWIKRPPQSERAKEVGANEWEIDVDELLMLIGGTAVA